MIPASISCVHDYIPGCEDCKKTAVLEIVTDLNMKLENVCQDPPPSVCESYKALECISELQKFSLEAEDYEDEAICM